MVKVKLLQSRAGNGFTQDRGQEVDVPANEVEGMIAAGQCELVRDQNPKTAVRKAKVERATR